MGIVGLAGEARPGAYFSLGTGLVFGPGLSLLELQERTRLLAALPAFVAGLVAEEKAGEETEEPAEA